MTYTAQHLSTHLILPNKRKNLSVIISLFSICVAMTQRYMQMPQSGIRAKFNCLGPPRVVPLPSLVLINFQQLKLMRCNVSNIPDQAIALDG